MRRISLIASALLLAVTLTAPTANAGFWGNVYQALDFASTPSGYPLSYTGDGLAVYGNRQGRLRILPDKVGNGYTLEFDRVFGTDTRGQPEVLDFGPLEVELSGAVQSTMSYTNNGYLIGNGQWFVSGLNYRVSLDAGGVDATVSGTLNVSNTLQLDQFGFYEATINVANDGSTLSVEDLSDVVTDEELDFDIGPVTVKGNVFLDAVILGLSALGVDTTGLQEFSGLSAVDQVAQALQDNINTQSLVAGVQITAPDDFVGPINPAITGLDFSGTGDSALLAPSADGLVAPEPASAVLCLLALAMLRRRN
ncbi:MAG: hypothetical protein JXO22_12300 [Phycisphaerae bacterium]|nr:hypothetical protein [Phycisphaerae bacterium]